MMNTRILLPVLIFISAVSTQEVIKIGLVTSSADILTEEVVRTYFTACATHRKASSVAVDVVTIHIDDADSTNWTLVEEVISRGVDVIIGGYVEDLEHMIAGSVPYIVLDTRFYDAVNTTRSFSTTGRRIHRLRGNDVISVLPVLAAMMEPLRKYAYSRVPNQRYEKLSIIVENIDDYEAFVSNQMIYGADNLVMPFIITSDASWNETRRTLASVRKLGRSVIFLHSQDRRYISKILTTAMSLDMMTSLYDWVLSYTDMDGLEKSLEDSLLKNCSSVLGLQLVNRSAFIERGLTVPDDDTLQMAVMLDSLDILILALQNTDPAHPITDRLWQYLRDFPPSYRGSLGDYGTVLPVNGSDASLYNSPHRAFIRHSAHVDWKEYRSCEYSQIYRSSYTLQLGKELNERKDKVINIPEYTPLNDTDRMEMPLFNMQPVKVAVALAPPFVTEITLEDGSKTYSGLMIDYLNLYAHTMNFSVRYEFADQDVGSFRDGKWSGSLGHLVDEDVSLAVGGISVNTQRSQYVDFTETMFPGMLSTLMKRPEIQSTPWQFLYPFSKVMWISIIVVFFMISALLCLMDHYDDTDNFPIRESFYYVAGILLSGSTDTNPQSTPSRVLIGCFMFFSIVVFQSYVANMAAFLTTRDDFDDIPQNMHDLISQNRMKLAALGEADVIIRQSRKEPLLGLSSKLLSERLHYADHESAIEDLRNGSFGEKALILVSSTTQYYSSQFCNVMYMHHTSDPILYSLALPKGSQIKRVFDSVITNVRELGKDLEITDRWYRLTDDCDHTGAEAYSANLETKSLSYVEMVGVFLVILIGVGVATAVGVAGELWRRFKTKRRDNKNAERVEIMTT